MTTIQFSQNVAKQACDQLEDYAQDIFADRVRLMDEVSDMHGVWKGDLASACLGQLESFDEIYEQIGKFVNSLNEHIEGCRENYQLVSDTNAERLKSIADMFK